MEILGCVAGFPMERFSPNMSILVPTSPADRAPVMLMEAAAIREIPIIATDRFGPASTVIARRDAGRMLSLGQAAAEWGAESLPRTERVQACVPVVVPWMAAHGVWEMAKEIVG